MLDLFPPDRYDAIITNAGGCGSHLRHYAPLLVDEPGYREKARLWDWKSGDIQEWLGKSDAVNLAPRSFETPVTVTYHESCHLVHGQKITRQPRALLRLLPGISLVELPESSWCCGSAGIYALTQPDQAEALLKRKVGHIASTHASIVATANPGCHLQVARGLNESRRSRPGDAPGVVAGGGVSQESASPAPSFQPSANSHPARVFKKRW